MRARARWASGLALGALALAASTGIGGCEARPRSDTPPAESTVSTGPAVVEIDLSHGDPEQQASTLFGPARQSTHLELVQALASLRTNDDAKGAIVRLGTAEVGFARANEVGRMLGELRAKGLPVVCHADAYSHSTLLLAALGCSKLWVSPAGDVDAVGIAAQLVFAKRLLAKLEVDVDFLQVGKYKGASEPFTRDSASPEARESLQRALTGIGAAWAEGIVKGRAREGIADVIEDGPFAADEAKERGLVDAVGYLEDARDDAKKLAGVDRIATRIDPDGPALSQGVLGVFRAIAGADRGSAPHIAVVRAVGAIGMSGGSSSILGGGDGIAADELGRVLARLANDTSAKAVVVRIDSPGGSALASDLLWKRLMQVREKKPLVFSIGGMAASGGYYMACTGTKIVADPTSIVGSIGVVGGKFAIAKTLEDIGVDVETVAATTDPVKASRAAYMSMYTGWDEPTKARMLASMKAVYELFLRRVSEGRNVAIEKVAASAEGQIFGGIEAQKRQLVDELGGLEDALRLAQKLAGLPDDAPIEAVGEGRGLLDLLGDQTGGAESEEAARAELQRRAQRSAVEALLPEWGSLAPEVRNLVASAFPITTGERTVAALPFAIILR